MQLQSSTPGSCSSWSCFEPFSTRPKVRAGRVRQPQHLPRGTWKIKLPSLSKSRKTEGIIFCSGLYTNTSVCCQVLGPLVLLPWFLERMLFSDISLDCSFGTCWNSWVQSFFRLWQSKRYNKKIHVFLASNYNLNYTVLYILVVLVYVFFWFFYVSVFMHYHCLLTESS